MNKKVLTLCASFLLAGGLTSSMLAENFAQVQAKFDSKEYVEGQYFYVYTNEDDEATLGNDKLDVNEDSYHSPQENRSTWWRLEAVKTKVNGTEEIIGYKLINALTGKAFTAKDATGKEYDTFYKDASETLAFVDANGSTCGFLYANGGRLSVVTSRPTSGRVTYNLKAVDPEALKAEEINKVNDDYFGLQFGYINNDGDYVNYESVNGSDPFAGKLVAKTESFGTNNQGTASTKIELKTSTDYPETYFIYNETAPDFVNAYPKTHQRIMARYVDAVSSA